MSEPFEYAIKKDVRNNPIVREVDESRQRELWKSVAVAGFFVAACCSAALQHFELLQHGYRVEEMQRQKADAEEEARRLCRGDRDAQVAPAHRTGGDQEAASGGPDARRGHRARADDPGRARPTAPSWPAGDIVTALHARIHSGLAPYRSGGVSRLRSPCWRSGWSASRRDWPTCRSSSTTSWLPAPIASTSGRFPRRPSAGTSSIATGSCSRRRSTPTRSTPRRR